MGVCAPSKIAPTVGNYDSQTLTFVGETATSVGDGYAGFRIGQTYQLQVEHRGDTVAIMLDHHAHVSPGAGPLVVTSEQFEKWFKRA